MSVLVQENNIHLIGNVQDGYIDQHVVIPLLSIFEMIESCNKNINFHISGKDSLCSLQPIIDAIRNSKVDVNIYIRNSEHLGGYNGVDGRLTEFLSIGTSSQVLNEEYNPPFECSIPEIQMMREMENYYLDQNEDNELNEDEE